VPATPVGNSVTGGTPPVPPTAPSSVGVNTGAPHPLTPGTPGNPLTLQDLMTPPGVLRTVQNTASSVAGALPPPPAPAPGGPAVVSVGAPPVPDGFTPLLASGVSNLIAPSPVNLPTIPGLPVPLPNQLPVPSDLLCAGTDWSATQGDSATAGPNADVPRVPVSGPAPATDRRDWGGQ
jgi:hypothetical protein